MLIVLAELNCMCQLMCTVEKMDGCISSLISAHAVCLLLAPLIQLYNPCDHIAILSIDQIIRFEWSYVST